MGCFDLLGRRIWRSVLLLVQDSEPAQVEGERKVKMGLIWVPSAVPRIHLPTVCSRLLPRHPHLPPTAWSPRGTLNRPQGTSKTLLRQLVALGAKLLPGWRPLDQ
jgi:hypothetical protein